MKAFIKLFLIISVSSLLTLCACATERGGFEKSDITLTLLNGEHYVVNGGNKVRVENGKAEFDITLEKGYNISGSSEAEFEISENNGWNKILTFTNVRYSNSVQLETGPVPTFHVKTEFDKTLGYVSVQCALGTDEAGDWYEGDSVVFTAKPNTGYYFTGWSKDGYIKDGGQFLSGNDSIILSADPGAIYANFRALADDGNCIVYDLGYGNWITCDCTAILAHHSRANTMTEKNIIDNGYGLKEDAMLAAWKTREGEYVSLGGKVTVTDKEPTLLSAVWMTNSPEEEFECENGVITDYNGSSSSVVIPKKIGGVEVTCIGENAFADCEAQAIYLPSTVTSVKANAFYNCALMTDFYMSDNITEISDESFAGCKNFATLHLNAYLAPKYINQGFSIKLNVYEKIIISSEKKVVVLAGSSSQYGFDYNVADEILNTEGNKTYDFFNLGLNCYMCGLMQYELFAPYMKEGDILLHAPEVWPTPLSGDRMNSVITGESAFSIEYVQSPWLFYLCEGDWQLISNLTINKYGDIFDYFETFNGDRYSLPDRAYYDYCPPSQVMDENGEAEINPGQYVLGQTQWVNFGCVTRQNLNDAKEEIYLPLKEKGVTVFYTFSPISIKNLLHNYGDEAGAYFAAEQYTDFIRENLNGAANVILTQRDTIYENNCFSNSDFHLAIPYCDGHTKKIVDEMKAHLG